ncbi:hypothetical protein D9M71_530710 [compost metagenome]
MPHRCFQGYDDDRVELGVPIVVGVTEDQAFLSGCQPTLTARRHFRFSNLEDRIVIADAPFDTTKLEQIRQQGHFEANGSRRDLLTSLAIELLKPFISVGRDVNRCDLAHDFLTQERVGYLLNAIAFLLVALLENRDFLTVVIKGFAKSLGCHASRPTDFGCDWRALERSSRTRR